MNECKLCGSKPMSIYHYDGTHKRNPGTGCTNPHCPLYEAELSEDEWEKLMGTAELPRLWLKVRQDLKHDCNVYLVSEDSEGWIGFFSTYGQAKDHAEFFSKMLGDIPIEYYEEVIVTRQKK